MTGFVAAVTVLLPFADPDLSYPLPAGADLRIAHPSRTHGPGCRAAVFSRDGTKLATVSDRTVLVREWPGGRRLMEIHFPRIHAHAMLALSPDGQTVAAGEVGSSRVVVGDLRSGGDGRLDSERSSHDRFSNSHLAFASNGVLRVFGERITDRLAPTGKFEAVDFDPASPKPLGRMPLPGPAHAIAADGSAAILKIDEELRRYDLTVQRLVEKGMKAPAKIEGIAVDATAGRVAVRDAEGKIAVFASATGERLMQMQLPAELNSTEGTSPFIPVELVLSPDGRELITAQDVVNPTIVATLMQVKDNKKLAQLADSSLKGRAASISYGPGAASLTVIGDDGHVRAFDRTTGKRSDPPTRPHRFEVSPNGRWIATYDGDWLAIHDSRTGAAVWLGWDTRGIGALGVNDDGKRMTPIGSRMEVEFGTKKRFRVENERLLVTDSTSGVAIREMPLPPKDEHEWGEAFQLVAAREGRTLAVAHKMHVDLFDSEFRHLRRIQVVPLRDRIGRQMFHDITEYATGVAVSADGRRVAIGKYVAVRGMPLGTEFFIHEVATGERVAHIDYVYGNRTPLGFTPNGRHLWTAGDGVALRYDLKPGPMPVFDRKNLLAELRGENAALADLAAGRLASPGMLAWLGEQLPADKQPDPKRVAELVRQLADRDFQVRETATAALIELGPGVVSAMKEVQKVATSQEAKRRATVVLNSVGGEASPGVLLRTRAVIAVAMLAEDGNPAARKLLDGWAKGMPGSPLTDDARAALARLPK